MPVPKNLIAVAPFFYVKDIAASRAYYRDVLGFDVDSVWGDPPYFCMAQRDGVTVMLSLAPDVRKVQPNDRGGDTWDLYVWCRDVEVLFEQVASAGAIVVYQPVVQPDYTMKEFAVRDVDGYVLAFGQHWPGEADDV
jgi:catechol 2,3-dioxygenase-like lactoylglutathione lyase family enzyme